MQTSWSKRRAPPHLLPRHRRRADRLHLRGSARLHLRRRSKTTSSLGLVGKDGEEPEIDARHARRRSVRRRHRTPRPSPTALLDWIKERPAGRHAEDGAAIAKLVDKALRREVDEAELRATADPGRRSTIDELLAHPGRLGQPASGATSAASRYVVPVGGLVVVETPSRKNAGAHYTPRSLAEEVVLYALAAARLRAGTAADQRRGRVEAEVQHGDPRPQGRRHRRRLRRLPRRRRPLTSPTGSPRRGSPRACSAPTSSATRRLAKDRAIREVIARCLYGADINPMAVEMCKLSLWLVSMDKTKPFSFVDDKIFCGNSLLGVTEPRPAAAPAHRPRPEAEWTLQLARRRRREDRRGNAAPQGARLAGRRARPDAVDATAKLRLLEPVRAGHRRPATDRRRHHRRRAAAWRQARHGSSTTPTRTLGWAAQRSAFPRDGSAGDRPSSTRCIDDGLTPTVETDYERWQPLHWVIEAPDVIDRARRLRRRHRQSAVPWREED